MGQYERHWFAERECVLGVHMCVKRCGAVTHDYMNIYVFFSLDVLPKAESQLNEIRNVMFTELKPQLTCELGK